jgi:hypothetical protein
MGKVGVDRLSAGLATTGGGGGGGTPSGSDTEIQYNDNGAFGSDPAFIRTPKGFFAIQADGGALSAETLLGSGDFTESGGDAIFAGGTLFFDDDTDIFVLAGDLTELSGEKSALTRVQEGDDTGVVFTSSGGSVLYYEGLIESSTVLAGQTEALLKFDGPTLTTEVSVNDNGIEILYDGVSAYTLPLADGTAGQVLSTDGAGVLDWVAAPIILEASVTIASADVLQLNSTPIEIVAAPGAGYAIEVVSASVKIDFNSAAYATNTAIQLIVNGATTAQYGGGILNATVATTKKLPEISTSSSTTTQLITNAALQVSTLIGNPTAGDSDITVYITYRIIML